MYKEHSTLPVHTNGVLLVSDECSRDTYSSSSSCCLYSSVTTSHYHDIIACRRRTRAPPSTETFYNKIVATHSVNIDSPSPSSVEQSSTRTMKIIKQHSILCAYYKHYLDSDFYKFLSSPFQLLLCLSFSGRYT